MLNTTNIIKMSNQNSKPKYTIIDDGPLRMLGQKNPNDIPMQRVESLSTDTNSVRKAISDLYKDFVMTKTQAVNGFGIYKALVDSMANHENKYIVVIVPRDNTPLGSQVYLKSIPWVSFQTRTTGNIKLEFSNFIPEPQTYQVKRNNILFDNISLATEDDHKYIYIPDHLPLRVELLKLSEKDQFSPNAKLISAIETYQCIITLE